MISPSPTPPAPMPPVIPGPGPSDRITQQAAEPKKVKLTPAKKRAGQAPLALFVKAILRPIIKLLYYLINGMRKHKIVALIAIILLLGSIGLTSYVLTGTVPLVGGGANDAVSQQIKANAQLNDNVKVWLYALRDGDLSTLEKMDQSMSQPPDTALYVLQYSEKYSGVKWNSISVVGPVTASDKLIDAYVEVNMKPSASTTASTGATTEVILWHFSTYPLPDGRIFSIDKVTARESQ